MAATRIKVLLVEDDPDNRELLAEVLREQFDVLTAADGAEGLACFTDQRPSVLVTDEALPGMRGTALAREVKLLDPGARVILVSGYSRPPGTDSCDVVLKKPLDLVELTSAISVVRSAVVAV